MPGPNCRCPKRCWHSATREIIARRARTRKAVAKSICDPECPAAAWQWPIASQRQGLWSRLACIGLQPARLVGKPTGCHVSLMALGVQRRELSAMLSVANDPYTDVTRDTRAFYQGKAGFAHLKSERVKKHARCMHRAPNCMVLATVLLYNNAIFPRSLVQ